jgi:hypothetical protein
MLKEISFWVNRFERKNNIGERVIVDRLLAMSDNIAWRTFVISPDLSLSDKVQIYLDFSDRRLRNE